MQQQLKCTEKTIISKTFENPAILLIGNTAFNCNLNPFHREPEVLAFDKDHGRFFSCKSLGV